MGGGDAVDAVAAELYVLPPARFTAERNARAAVASAELAAGIRMLRRPTVAAWAVNLLVRDGQLAEAIELSHALHEAQDALDAPALAALGRQRRALSAGLARRAAELAAQAGSPLSASARDEVERTVNAAILDESAAAAVLTGRLVRAEVGPDAPADAVAGSRPGVPARPAPTRDDLAARRARKAAEAEARRAERVAADAGRDLARAEDRLSRSRERADRLHERIDELRAELARLSTEADRADGEALRQQGERDAAARAARDADSAAQRARRAAPPA